MALEADVEDSVILAVKSVPAKSLEPETVYVPIYPVALESDDNNGVLSVTTSIINVFGLNGNDIIYCLLLTPSTLPVKESPGFSPRKTTPLL